MEPIVSVSTADQDDFKRLWNNAFDAYEKETGRKLMKDNALHSLRSVDDLANRIEAEGSSFAGWRNKHHKLWSRLSTCFKPVIAFEGLARDVLTATPFAAASAVLGAALYLIKAGNRVADAYDWIETVFGELQEFADRLNLYQKNELDNALKKKVAAILVFFLKVIGSAEHLVLKGSFKHYLRVVFLGRDDKTRKILDDLNESLKSEQSYVIAATYTSSVTAVRDGKSVLSKVNDIAQGIGESYAREITREDEHLIQQSLESQAVNRTLELNAEYRKRLLNGTGTWLEKEVLFTTWSKQRIPILWIFGGPGSGKSHLSTWTINHLEVLYEQNQGNPSGVSIAFFYVKENETQLRDANTILKTLAWQITLVDPVFKKHAVQVCSIKKKIITAEETWSNLFLAFYRPVRTVDRSAILLIDGLDEAPKSVRETILGFCKDLLVQDTSGVWPRIQIAIVGRITLKGDMEFEREEKFIEVSQDKNRDDIDKYIEKRLSDLELLKTLEKLDKVQLRNPPRQRSKPLALITRKRLKDQILAKADGIFLWAQLLLDQIQKKEKNEIEKILNSPPQTLEDMIRLVFERLAAEEDDLDTIKRLLSWIAYARRPLYFGEIDLILSLPSGSPNLLLWDAFRGKFASIFQLQFPQNYAEEVDGDGENFVSSVNEFEQEQDTTFLGNPSNNHLDQQNDEDKDSKTSEDSDTDENSTEGEDENNNDKKDDTFRLFDVAQDRGLTALATNISLDKSRCLRVYSDFQLRTIITFSHQQFRDFLVQQHERAPMDLDIDIKQSQTDITMTCFDILRHGDAEQGDTRYLADYPSRNFVHHLESINSTVTAVEDKEKILKGLYWIFHELDGIQALVQAPTDSDSPAWDEYWSTWIAVDTYTKVIQKWFDQINHIHHSFDVEATAWMKAAALSRKQLFQLWIENLACIWLEKTGFDDEAYLDKSERVVWLMHGLISLNIEGIISEDLKGFVFYQLDFRKLSIKRIEHLASYAPIKNTPHWHIGLAWILMEASYNEPAISHFQEALTMEPNAWVAKEGLARIYGCQGRYLDAIKLMQEAYDSLPSKFNYLGGFLIPRIAEWKMEIGDRTGAYDAAHQAYMAEPSSPLAQFHYLKALDDANSSEDIITTIQYLVGSQWMETSMSLFSRLLIQGYEVFDIIGHAFRATTKALFIVDAMDETLNTISNTKDDFMRMYLHGQVAFFKYRYDDQVEPSIKLFEQALKLTAACHSLTKAEKRWYQNLFGNNLAQLYFDLAVAARKAGLSTWPITKKLKKMATVTNTTAEDADNADDAFDFYGTGYASMIWGCWLRDYEAAEGPVWRKCFKARILEELELLNDNDLTNDMRGLHTLGITLLHIGENRNTTAILAILFKPLEDVRVAYANEDGGNEDREEADRAEDLCGENSNGNDTNAELEEPETMTAPFRTTDGRLALNLSLEWIHECNGPCNTPSWKYNELFICKICLSKKFCGDCLQLVKAGTLVRRDCCPDHDWYRAWPIPEPKWEGTAEEVEGHLVMRTDWLEKIRSEWL